VAVAGIVVPVVVLMIFVIIVVMLVKSRNTRRTDVSSLSSVSSMDTRSIALTDLDNLSDIRSISSVAPSVRSHGTGRHRIMVKSADQASAAGECWSCFLTVIVSGLSNLCSIELLSRFEPNLTLS
jgi:hypothetical protein